jgi:hypothetical protein
MQNLVSGTHTHTAKYPADAYYATLGSFSVTVVPRAP